MASHTELLLWLLVAAVAAGRCFGIAVSGEGGNNPLPPGSTGSNTVRLADNSHIRGFRRTVSGRNVWNYLGVPYAKPPVGPLRFRRPEPLDAPIGLSYREPFDAFYKPKSCYFWPTSKSPFEINNPALLLWWNNTEMSEDCLYLNVWTPTESQGDKKAVMVWIFGGGFYGGSASLEIYDGGVLASKGDVIVASMQYRTGAFGFLHLDPDEAPGNMGLMDQRLAMKWIWTNARYFGGDPSRVTIFGESAGAVSVNFHMLLPESQKYFSRAIMNSGSALAYWASEDQARARYRAYTLASRLSCYVADGNRKRIINCMRHKRPAEIQAQLYSIVTKVNDERVAYYSRYRTRMGLGGNLTDTPYYFFYLPLRPVYGTEFIPEDPRISVHKDNMKKTDVMLGVVKNEGIFWIVYALSSFFLPKMNLSNNKWHLPFWWGSSSFARREDHEIMKRVEKDPAMILAKYFMHGQNLNPLIVDSLAFEYQLPSEKYGFTHWTSKDVLYALDEITGDNTFKCPVVDFAEFYLRFLERKASLGNNVWMYSFEHHTEKLSLPDWTGAMHGYELDYIFGAPFNDNFTRNFYKYTPGEEELSRDMLKFWSNFAKTGNPNQPEGTRNIQEHIMTWPPYRTGNRSNIVLEVKQGAGSYKVGENLRRRKCNFWNAQMRNIHNYMQLNAVPCITEPKKSTQNLSSGSAASGSSAALLTLISLTIAIVGLW